MMMEAVLAQLEEAVRARFQADRSGHDVYHLKRVLNLALRLQEREGGNRMVIAAAALLHDVHRILEHETGTYCAPADALPEVERFLDETDLAPELKRHVLHCVAFHEEYGFSASGRTARDLETLIVQDADNLDALGAVGVARTFAFGGAYGVPLWEPELPFDRVHYDEATRDPSVIHHFQSKLLRLKDHMHTETAKRMALERHAFMQRFVDTFFEEWQGRR